MADRKIDLTVDLAVNMFGRPGDPAEDVRARNINTIDEVPDSSWFTNRVGARSVTPEEIATGPLIGDGPAPGRWSVISPKLSGFAPGFTMLDARGDRWFVSFDAAGHPEAATGAIAVANKLFWALGYWQVENFLVSINRGELDVNAKAIYTPESGRDRPMRDADLDLVLVHPVEGPAWRAVRGPGRPAVRARPGAVPSAGVPR